MRASDKKICALTMVRNDEFFLSRWIAYYGRELGAGHLYVFLDGLDQTLQGTYPDVHIEAVEHIEGNVRAADRGRIDFLSRRAALLLKSYDLVIGTDADEFLVVDPLLGLSLSEYLSQTKIRTSLSALGIDVGQHLKEESPLDRCFSFLSQRRYALLSDRYSKASVIARPVSWGSGFHRVRKHNFHIAKGLFLFHFGSADYDMLNSRFSDETRMKSGWGNHLNRRARTISIVNKAKPKDWDDWVAKARRLQNIFRQPYAWNKPTMLRKKVVVAIPKRFQSVV